MIKLPVTTKTSFINEDEGFIDIIDADNQFLTGSITSMQKAIAICNSINKTEKINIVHLNDDWEGIYVNNDLLQDCHSLQVYDILRKLGYDVTVTHLKNDEIDNLPQTLSELKPLISESIG